MTCRRQLLNFGSRTTDLRMGAHAFEELPRLFGGAVSKPCRAFLLAGACVSEDDLLAVRRALIDASYSVTEFSPADGKELGDFACVGDVLAQMGEAGLTAEDLLVGVGDTIACSLASFCAHMWCNGMPCALVPTTLDAMLTCTTQMQPLSAGQSAGGTGNATGTAAPFGLVSMTPEISLAVCNLDLARALPVDANGLGYVRMVAAALTESRKRWDDFGNTIEGIVAGDEIALLDAVCSTANSRLHTVKSVSPSARRAFLYGETTAAALRTCLAEQGVTPPAYLLLAEGLRFEARMATDATGFAVDDMFCQDDYLEDLGVDELTFSIEPERFVEALRAERLRHANRFQFALPKHPGTIRLTAVDDEVLERHARAFLASRAP